MTPEREQFPLAVSVVIPTKNRPALLRSCVEVLLPQLHGVEGGAEIVIVDDGDGSAAQMAALDPRITVVRGRGEGPGRARNRGLAAAKGAIVAFTDDDARCAPDWLACALAYLEHHPDAVGVRGEVLSVDFDPLYEHSVADATGGGYLTCNVAYRHWVLEAIGGFDPAFRYAHEDRDLGYRAEAHGVVGFCPEMRVEHPPRPFTIREWARRGRFVTDDWLLYARYPDQARGRSPLRLKPLEGIARRWVGFLRDPGVRGTGVRRHLRLVLLALGQLLVGLRTTVVASPASARSTPPPRPLNRTRPLRVAYLGPVPNPTAGGAPGVAGLIFQYLCAQGVTIDCYVPVSAESDAADEVAKIPGVSTHLVDTGFRFGRWYSSHPLTKMISAQAFTARGRTKSSAAFLADHRRAPFDVLYQFSTVELFGLRHAKGQLPPIATHPSVHASGELRWLRAERHLAAGGEGRLRAALVRSWVAMRSRRQRTDISLASSVLALSHSLGEQLVEDYGIDPGKVTVVPNAIDLDRFQVPIRKVEDGPLRVVVLGRITVRKGLEDLVAATQLLADLEGALSIEVIGDHSLWSDYRHVLNGLHPGVARYLGHRPRTELQASLGHYDLLAQLSHYEPFGLTVAEALASGVPVLATEAVGAAEGLPPEVCSFVEAGHVEAIAAALRAAVDRHRALDDAGLAALQARCRAEAERRYSKWHIGRLAHDALRACAAGGVERLERP